MHVPETEYHFYIKELEEKMQKPLPELHQHLEKFAEKVRMIIKEIMEEANMKYTLIDPIKQYNASNPIDSYKFTYNQLPTLFHGKKFFAFEDISEFKLISGSPVKNGIFAVLDNPDPYTLKSTDEENSITLNLLNKIVSSCERILNFSSSIRSLNSAIINPA